MIRIEHIETYGWDAAIRGMRNPLNSWGNSDTHTHPYKCEDCPHEYVDCSDHDFLDNVCMKIGENDLALMRKLVAAGTDHSKFMRMINVAMDITAPLYWWKEYDTYKVGTVANSCSTMHKIHAKKFTLDDFSYEHLDSDIADCGSMLVRKDGSDTQYVVSPLGLLSIIVDCLNVYRDMFIHTNDKKYWWQMIQILPASYNQRRTVQLNYAVLRNMYHARKNHKLDEWREFCDRIETLPYSELIHMGKEGEKDE